MNNFNKFKQGKEELTIIQDELTSFIQRKVEESNSNGVILGLSGGIDSALSATLAVEALGRKNVTGLVMPGKPTQQNNHDDALFLAEELGIDTLEIPIVSPVDMIEEVYPENIDSKSKGNVRARVRMIYNYIYSNTNNYLVLGTGNKSEFLMGYFTKYGDGAVDITAILDLYKTEVRRLASYMGVNQRFIDKEPTAGLWQGQTDKDELGLSYAEIDPILYLYDEENFGVEQIVSQGLDRENVEKVLSTVRSSKHKRESMPHPKIDRDY